MAEIIWTESALAELDAIADYIAIENAVAAKNLVQRIFKHVEQLASHPESGRYPPELGRQMRYRELIEPPCRIFYRLDASLNVFIVHIMRGERILPSSKFFPVSS
ncbi:plasmid stabilization protein [Lysobacteraceae bacterium NML75-0749]|nr:plasmid stabilization protein [Xanthomonadaceae bacterium NML75-0749]PJK03100.1 plasmid stabilization protein [Xanthomonadaceae bacterium NML91-0268]